MKGSATFYFFGIMVLYFHLLSAGSLKTENFSDTDRMKAIQSFNYVWETIRDKYYDRTLGGLDWQGVYDRWYPRLLNATSRQEVSHVLLKLTDTLGVSHVGISPSFFCENDLTSELAPGDLGSLGCEVRILENRPFVFRIYKDYPADRAGLTFGCEIISLDGSLLNTILGDMADQLRSHPQRDLILANWMNGRLSGEAGDSLKMVWQQSGGQPINSELIFKACEDKIFQLGLFPTTEVWMEVDTLSGDIGYISFNAFMYPSFLMPKFNDAIKAFMDCRGIIIDLRGNAGGLVNLAQGMAGWFISQEGSVLGSMCYRDLLLQIPVVPRSVCFQGKLAVLIDEKSACTAEILAAGLQDAGRARLFGTTTAGAAAASTFERLSSGDGFQYATACYRSAAGERVEGQGIQPDVSVPLTITDLQQGIDPVIQAACQWIK